MPVVSFAVESSCYDKSIYAVCLLANAVIAPTQASGCSMCGMCPTPVNVLTFTDGKYSSSAEKLGDFLGNRFRGHHRGEVA